MAKIDQAIKDAHEAFVSALQSDDVEAIRAAYKAKQDLQEAGQRYASAVFAKVRTINQKSVEGLSLLLESGSLTREEFIDLIMEKFDIILEKRFR